MEMSNSTCSSASYVTASSGDPSSEPHPWGSLIQNTGHPSPALEALHPEYFTPRGAASDPLSTSQQPLPVVIFPRAGTLACLMLERGLAVAINTQLESNLAEREVAELFQGGEMQFSTKNKKDMGLNGRNLGPGEGTSESSGSGDGLVLHPTQTGGAIGCGSDCGRSTGSEERPWVLASEGRAVTCGFDCSGSTGGEDRPWVLGSEGAEESPGELASVLKSLHDERVKQRTAAEGVWGYLGYGKAMGSGGSQN